MRGWWRAVQETRGSGWGVRRWFLSHTRSSRGWGRAAACPMRTGRWSHLSAGLGCPCVGSAGSGARGLRQCPDRRLSRKPVAVPGDPIPDSRSCIPTSFPAQKIDFLHWKPWDLVLASAFTVRQPHQAHHHPVVCGLSSERGSLSTKLQQGEMGNYTSAMQAADGFSCRIGKLWHKYVNLLGVLFLGFCQQTHLPSSQFPYLQ